MTEITLQLPEILSNQLALLARQEGVSLDDYVLYGLGLQVTNGYILRRLPSEEVARQAEEFAALLARWGKAASDKTIDQILAEREIGEPDPDLTPELVATVRTRIAEARQRQQATKIKETI